MQQITLYLARHGESISNFHKLFIGQTENTELTQKGIQQAKKLAKSLEGKQIDAIFSSTLIRARQTAQIIADAKNLPVYETEDLIEVDLGRLAGFDVDDPAFLSVYENMVTNWEKGHPQVSILEGESLIDVQTRLEKFLEEKIFSRGWNNPVLLVGHSILWMGLIWVFCENRPPRIKEGFMKKTHLSVISKNGSKFFLLNNNLNHEEIMKLKNPC